MVKGLYRLVPTNFFLRIRQAHAIIQEWLPLKVKMKIKLSHIFKHVRVVFVSLKIFSSNQILNPFLDHLEIRL